jgi:hypothetical protein
LIKLKGRTLTAAWCLTAFVALGWHSTVGPAFASCRLAQTSIIRPSRKPPSTTVSTGVMVEEFSFLIKDFKIEHQGETNNLNITIQYRYRVNISDPEYPDFRPIAKDVETFLTNYPNEKDYWETLNKKITLFIIDKYPPITKITCQVEVSPSPLVHYLRSSIVTRDRTGFRHSVRSPIVR